MKYIKLRPFWQLTCPKCEFEVGMSLKYIENTKIYQKCKFYDVWAELNIKIYFLGQPWTKYCRKI